MTQNTARKSTTKVIDNNTQADDLKIRLGFLLQDCARLRKQHMDKVFKPLSVTQSQAWLLAFLSRGDGITQTELAQRMGLGKVAVGSLVDKLEAREMITRKPHLTDRRVNRLFISEKGNRVVEHMRDATLSANDNLLVGLDHEQLKSLVDQLTLLKHNLLEC